MIIEAKEEYINRFVEGSIGRVMWEPASSMRPHLTDLTIPDDGPLGPAAMAKLPPLDISPEEATLLGYMPQRDDFEKVCSIRSCTFEILVEEY